MRQSAAAATFSLKEARDATEWEGLLKDLIAPFVTLARSPPTPMPDAMQVSTAPI